MNTRTYIYSKTIDLAKFGWSEVKNDEEIVKYIITFMKLEHGVTINKETALAFMCVIDDLLTDIQNKKVVIE